MRTPRAPWLLDYAYAHRGLWRQGAAPENSLPAFAAARMAGLGVELDVRISADGEAMVFHDSTLERMTKAKGYTNSRTAAELSRLRLLGHEATIPTLAEALDVLEDTPTLVELKVNHGSEGPLERRVVHVLAHHPGPVAVMSFNPATLSEIAGLAPDLPRGLLCEGWRRGHAPLFPWTRRALVRAFTETPHPPPDFIACEVSALATFGRPAAETLRAPLIAWTVRTRAQIDRAERHAHAMIFENLDPGLVRPARTELV
ncbi:MAG: glycerophosphodiester phosphodiesterase [Hydrogenophilaceae bacterium]|jgi:glycerophosphoryl diester phosphodiesterase|nr:glycerophosphodiester phosphodiesterase [Hydrogenophilaceae bacterium]